jgi:hypothetical protein
MKLLKESARSQAPPNLASAPSSLASPRSASIFESREITGQFPFMSTIANRPPWLWCSRLSKAKPGDARGTGEEVMTGLHP